MLLPYVQECEYIAMFDADFQPEPDFLLQTIPFLVHNPEIALVQSLNADECLMTRMQEISLNYHFKVEQQGGSSTFAFFGYNGTAGVWRISAIDDAGGWNDRTTVEDMDLSVRACLKGWKFIYDGDIKVSHMLTFIFFCVIIPLSIFVPEASIPYWGIVYVPLVITVCKAVETPRSLHLLVFWVLFENAMSLHRLKAAMTGLLEARRANEWIVTEKSGDSNKPKPSIENNIGIVVTSSTPCINQNRKKHTSKLWQR
ncbi:hypothetical protein Taro_034359 [Colocasia esculenta]|uniref:Glycosyltransferase 2-like domain-containing protein n=1 Tax=Colocasia esculenta TaxID=4460 RepID=A0A843W7D7_COLES|nr:hypothetical protein [Colocasia esculenta]